METIEASLFAGFASRDAGLLRRAVLEAIQQGSKECVLHPLGFYLIRLAARGNTTIRLHYWPLGFRGEGAAVTPYHDHVWSLCSCVLAGAIENVLLDVYPDDHGDFNMAHIAQAGGIDDVIPAPARVRMHVRSRETYCSGSIYELPPRVFHFTDVPFDRAAITVVQATVAVDGGPRTLVPVGTVEHSPARVPVQEPWTVLSEIDRLLGSVR